MLCFIFLSLSSTLLTFDFTPAMVLPGPPNAPPPLGLLPSFVLTCSSLSQQQGWKA